MEQVSLFSVGLCHKSRQLMKQNAACPNIDSSIFTAIIRFGLNRQNLYNYAKIDRKLIVVFQ